MHLKMLSATMLDRIVQRFLNDSEESNRNFARKGVWKGPLGKIHHDVVVFGDFTTEALDVRNQAKIV